MDSDKSEGGGGDTILDGGLEGVGEENVDGEGEDKETADNEDESAGSCGGDVTGGYFSFTKMEAFFFDSVDGAEGSKSEVMFCKFG